MGEAVKRRYSDLRRIIAEIYEAQPIYASGREKVSVPIPEKLRSVRSLAKGVGAYRQPRELIFLHQAQLLKDYEDDYEYTGEIYKFFPTYESLDDEQLRGYFGWRTRLRKGIIEKGSSTFAYLYIYELLNMIGTDEPEEALCKLREFAEEYSKTDRSICAKVDRWLLDFTVYHQLDPALISDLPALVFDKALSALLSPEDRSDEEMLDAVCKVAGSSADTFSGYRLNKELFSRLAARSYKEISRYYDGHMKHSFIESNIGSEINAPVTLFSSAVFYMPKTDSCFDYRLSDITVYHCEKGKWGVKSYPGKASNEYFTGWLKLIDHLVLVNEGKEDTVNTGIRTKWTVKLLTKLAKECKDEIETEKARRVEIDMSALDRIRYEAAGTREKLITEEDLDVFPSDSHMEDSAPDEPKGSEGMEDISTYDLTADELRFLKMLISGEDIRILRSEGLILSVLADSVNEKLFDIFSDSVIEIGDVPCLIEDYIDDLRNMGIA